MKHWLTFLCESDGSFSWGRCIGLGQFLTAAVALLYVVFKTHSLPDAVTLGGLTAWSISAFSASKGMTAFARPQNADKL